MNQVSLLIKLYSIFVFLGFILISVSCIEKKINVNENNGTVTKNVKYIFVSKPIEKKYQKIKYIGGVWDFKNIKIINLKKKYTIIKKVNIDKIYLNEKGFLEKQSDKIIGERLKINNNIFRFNSLDSLNGNYSVKSMKGDSLFMSSGPVIKVTNNDASSQELIHIEILLISSDKRSSDNL